MSRKPIVDAFPLSPMQQGMLFHHLKERHAGVDVEQLIVHLQEEIDVRRLEAAWKWLVDRHDILRAQFVWEGVEQPHQEVLSEVPVPFVVEDARRLRQPEQYELFKSFLQTDRLRGFELDRAPLLRLTLFQWDEASFSLVWTFHHALLDGRCFPTLLREVFEAYAELDSGEVRARPAAPAYRRYIEWLQVCNFAAVQSFWKELLDGFTAPTALMVDRQIPAGEGVYQHGETWEMVDSSVTARLRQFALEHDLTVNSLVMGAWAILLHNYSREQDIVFGATRACRKSTVAGADETIGLFINTVPVRVKLRGDDDLLAVLKAVRRQWLDMRPYEHTPLARVKAVSQVPPTQPLFKTLLVFESFRLDTAMRSLGGAWATRKVELHELTNFPITLAAYDGEELSFKIEFDRRRLDDAAVRRMLGHMRRLLEAIAANPQAAIGDLPIVSETERRELIEDFNVPAKAPFSRDLPLDGSATLHGLFEMQVAKSPNAVALTCDGVNLTYAELNAQANRLAHRLRGLGVEPNVLVGLCLERSNDLVAALLAILKAGGAYLPIDLAYPAERLAFMLEDAQAPVLLTQSALTGNLPSTQAKVLCVDEVLAQPAVTGEKANLSPLAGPDDLSYVIYTSGTTGKPKGSMITHRNVVRLFPATEHWYGFGENDVWTLFHSCAFDFSVWEIWGALLYGGRVVVVPFLVSRSPEAFYELLAKEQVTVLNQTPSAFRQLIQAEESVGQKELALRYVIFGGEALEMQSLRPWFERHGDRMPRLVNMYGITETTVHVTYRPLSKDDVDSGSVIGVPIPDLQIYILDAQRQPVPIGVPGEMYVGGAGLARGYLRRPELTAERFIPDHLTGRQAARLYRTGDLARFLPGRDVEYLGRIDHQVKIRGFRIELGEIESVLCQHPAVREAAVFAREDAGGKRLVAYVVTASAPMAGELREYLRRRMPDYMVPSAFVFLERLPLTNNGKIDRKALPQSEQERPDLAAQYVAPRTEMEEKLGAIWSKVLRLERVGVQDNFFELGGDSILSIQVISLARQAELTLTPKLLFQNPTIAELAAVTSPVVELPKAEQGQVEGMAPLMPIEHWFFEQELADSQHYNQSFLFTVKEPLDMGALERALAQLERHHDALRLRYAMIRSRGEKTFASPSATAPFERVDLSAVAEFDLAGSIETAAALAQATLDYTKGPLWRAVYFDCGSKCAPRLLVVIHHLAVDGVSWRILLEDLERIYQQERAGQKGQLHAKTTSVKEWSERLSAYASDSISALGVDYWRSATSAPIAALPIELHEGSDTEGSAHTLTLRLEAAETESLLYRAPAAYNTQINDLLLAAFSASVSNWTGSDCVALNLEGHGREDLFEGVDLSRTVGWFTSIYPVHMHLPKGDLAAVIKSVKEQLRAIPARGIGFGLLRYLVQDQRLQIAPETEILFNYLGQIDQVVAGSRLFDFAPEQTGPWHSPNQRRRHLIELNCAVVHGRLEVWWTYSRNRYRAETMEKPAAEFIRHLREVIDHCTRPGVRGATPSDFPLAALDQPALDGLVAGIPDLEDVYALAPIQTLFYAAGANDSRTLLDQWHCTLTGRLDTDRFRKAWSNVVAQHSVLRSSFHSSGLKEPVQVVHKTIRIPWVMEDWRGLDSEEQASRWQQLVQRERDQGLVLDQAPLHRITLVQLAADRFKFLWSVPALLLDGWSWPLVFRDLSDSYHSLIQGNPPALPPVRPYRDYISWIRGDHQKDTEQFWREKLKGMTQSTPLISEPGDASSAKQRVNGERTYTLDAETTSSLIGFARRLRITSNSLIQAAWSIVLSRLSGWSDVTFGAAFAGRPTDLPNARNIVGPFMNNLPLRVRVEDESSVEEHIKRLHEDLLELNPHQFAPLTQIQSWSEISWRDRLFDSLVVVQNYEVDEAAQRLGDSVAISEFSGPIHTNFPLLVLVEPESSWRITLIYDRRELDASRVERWGNDFIQTLSALPAEGRAMLGTLKSRLSAPATRLTPKPRFRMQSQNYVPPQNELQQVIAGAWQEMFQSDRISIEDNLFDLGAHSMLVMRLHQRLREALDRDFALVTLFQFPTIRSFAGHLDHGEDKTTVVQVRSRAQQQRLALARMRPAPVRK